MFLKKSPIFLNIDEVPSLMHILTGVLFTNRMIPVCDRRVTRHPAWSASTKQVVLTDCPRGSGMLCGKGSTASGYVSPQYALTKRVSSNCGDVSSNTMLDRLYCFRYAKQCNTCSKCPSRGNARNRDSSAIGTMMSIRPSSTIQRSTPIKP